MLTGLTNLVRAVGGLPNTFWGILVLFSSMYIAVKYNSDIGYYFAGVGSTLLGIQHYQDVKNAPNMTMTVDSKPSVKVESNASDQTS